MLVEPWVLDGDLVARAAAGAQRAVDAGDGAAQDDEVRAVDSVGLEVGTHPRGEVGVEMRSTVAIALRPDAGEDLLQVGQEGGIGIGDLQVERAGRGRSVGELALGRAGQDAGAAAAVAGHDALGAKRLVSGGGGPRADVEGLRYRSDRREQRLRRDAPLPDERLDLRGQLDRRPGLG